MQTAVARHGEKCVELVVKKTTSVSAPTAATAANKAGPRKEVEAKAEAEEEEETKDKAVADKAKTINSPALLSPLPRQCSGRRERTG